MISAFGVDHIEKAIGKPGPGGFKLRRMPFLHPKAPPYSSAKHVARDLDFAQGAGQIKARKRGGGSRGAYKFLPRGPAADKKTLQALSGKDVGETISRFGRATRRQNKEFHGLVHPISGRLVAMERGDYAGAHMPRRASIQRIKAEKLAAKSKNPEVQRRATKLAAEGSGGPKLLSIHNHPSHGAGKGRGYPSAQDFTLPDTIPGQKGVVVSHRPGPRGSKKTRAVFFGQGPDKISGKSRKRPNQKASRKVKPEERMEGRQNLALHDFATQTEGAHKFRRTEGVSRRVQTGMHHGQIRGARGMIPAENKPGGQPRSWDAQVRRETKSKNRAARSGIHTRETFFKSAFGIVHDMGVPA